MDGTSFSLSKDSALNYGDKIVEGIVPNNTILRMKDLPEELKIYIKSEVKKLTVDDYIEGTAFEKIVSSLAGIAKGRKKNAIDLTEFFPKSKIDDEIRVLNKDGIKVTPKLSHLEQEAKGKTLEEFVSSKGVPLYHGTPFSGIIKELKAGDKGGYFGKGVYLSGDKNTAKLFTDNLSRSGNLEKISDGVFQDINTGEIIKSGKPQLLEVYNEKLNLKQLTEPKYGDLIEQYRESSGRINLDEARAKITEQLKKDGYDGIHIRPTEYFKEPQVVVFDSSLNKLKTKQQLTDIWNRINKN